MEYEQALRKAWAQVESLTEKKRHSVRFLNDNYDVDPEKRSVLSLSCNAPAKSYLSILILHYLIRALKGLPTVKNEWISFKELPGGAGYYPTFKKRVIDTVIGKYGSRPDCLLEITGRFKAKKAQLADISVVLETFDNVPVLITFWRGDDEFGPEANVLFDKGIVDIFCTEDIVVLAEFIAHSI
ncbi:MAG: DUF3786 domain-containing protein [Omnitrophica bacterium]|nr:DUF3786 domain-containing protein [Candidatus Omnitrophota bacterium]